MRHNLWVALICLFSACDSTPQPPSKPAPGPTVSDVKTSAPDVMPRGELANRIEAAVAAKTKFRTRHLKDGKPLFSNRLVLEASPYLQQHAHNPVNWFPWGDEAFELARATGRPVLLSIGYSTCHWCHVMEEESFEDLEIARLINDNYIPIKVDREERPDVDATYMKAVLQLTGRGGWPMTMWLTSERTPFFGGTYFPPRAGARGARSGFSELLGEWAKRYREDPSGIVERAQDLASGVARGANVDRSGEVTDRRRAVTQAERAFARSYDSTHHGWGRQKFPMPSRLRLLLRAAARERDGVSSRMVFATLDAMARGGIFDQVGGGFHRYTVDPAWRVPHFEKMLYDNAMLVLAYTEAWQITHSALYREVVERTIAYLLREMRSPEGAFYAATDADSGGEEGSFFVWTPEEIDAAAPGSARTLKYYLGVSDDGNFEGKNVLYVAHSLAETAQRFQLSPGPAHRRLQEGIEQLRRTRESRIHPDRDEKVLAAWNGLTIEALARAGFAFDRPDWIDAAAVAAKALPRDSGGRLLRSATDGQPGPAGFAEDFAFVIASQIALFEATGDGTYLDAALAEQKEQDRLFWDAKRGGYFANRAEAAAELFVRSRPYRDGAIPSPNSVALLNLTRLAALRADESLRQRRQDLERAFTGSLQSQGASAPQMLLALDWLANDPKEVAIVGEGDEALLAVLRTQFHPNLVLARGQSSEQVPWLKAKVAHQGRATAYVCRDHACKLPTTNPEEFAQQLRTP